MGTQRGLICTYVHVAVILKFEFYCKGEMSAYLHMYVLYVHMYMQQFSGEGYILSGLMVK